jgi:hypothetical protein
MLGQVKVDGVLFPIFKSVVRYCGSSVLVGDLESWEGFGWRKWRALLAFPGYVIMSAVLRSRTWYGYSVVPL